MGAIPHKAVTNRFLPTGENKTSEAPGAIFDLTIGEKGVETPLPNDSSIASISPPVGGHLRSFRKDWHANNCSSNSLDIITNGYILPFLSKPNLVRFPLIISEYKALPKDQALADCIWSLLSKNAIERVENVEVEASNRLNQAQHFSTPRKVLNGNSRVHQDLPDSRSQVFQFISLPFGLATAPRSFTMIVKEVKLMALSRGLRLHQYLDNWLIRSQSQEETQVNTQAVVNLTRSLGWVINQQKKTKKNQIGKLLRCFLFVGYEYHLDSALVKPTQEKCSNLRI